MTDIVDRLNDSLSAGYSELRKEAAAEIMQLRAKISDLTINIEYFNKLKTSYEELIGELQEERDTLKQAHLNGMGASREAALMAKLEAAEKERDALRTLVVMRCDLDCPPQFTQGHEFHEFTEPVTAEHCRWFVAEIERLRTDCDALRARVEAMERQEPVGTVHAMPGAGAFTMACFDAQDIPVGAMLYALPGAKGE